MSNHNMFLGRNKKHLNNFFNGKKKCFIWGCDGIVCNCCNYAEVLSGSMKEIDSC